MKSSAAEAKINRLIGKAISRYNLIQKNDKILIAVSGGKDSLILLYFLRQFQKKSPVPFELEAVYIEGFADKENQTKNGNNIANFCNEIEIKLTIENQPLPEIAERKTKKGKLPCPLCAKLRRGVLYRLAEEKKTNKIALGHNRDDLIETLLLNLFYSGKIRSMAPLYKPKGKSFSVIRPLFSVPSGDIKQMTQEKKIIISKGSICPYFNEDAKRKRIRTLLTMLSYENPSLNDSLFAALSNIDTGSLP